jgi:hypothetical protein
MHGFPAGRAQNDRNGPNQGPLLRPTGRARHMCPPDGNPALGSQEDNPAPRRRFALDHRVEYCFSWQWEFPCEIRPGKPQDVSVVPRIRDEKEHGVASVVASLQRQPPGAPLHIAKARLCLDGQPPAASLDDGIPCAPITWDGERYFRSPAQPVGQQNAQLRKERELGDIAERLASREGAERKVQPEDCSNEHQRVVRNMRRLAELDPAQL